MAAFVAAWIGAGTPKCGSPMLRFTGSLRLRARSNTLRIPDISMVLARSAIQWSCIAISGPGQLGGLTKSYETGKACWSTRANNRLFRRWQMWYKPRRTDVLSPTGTGLVMDDCRMPEAVDRLQGPHRPLADVLPLDF